MFVCVFMALSISETGFKVMNEIVNYPKEEELYLSSYLKKKKFGRVFFELSLRPPSAEWTMQQQSGGLCRLLGVTVRARVPSQH